MTRATRVVLLVLVLALGTIAFAAPVAPVVSAGHRPCEDKVPGYCWVVNVICPIKWGWYHCYPI